MKKESSGFFKILLIISFAVAAIGGVLLYLGFTTQFDTVLSHFEFGSVSAAACAAVAVLSVVAAFAGGIFARKSNTFNFAAKFSFPEALTSGVCAFLSFAYAIYLIVLVAPPETREGFFYAQIALVGLSGIYFVMKALGMTAMNKKLGFLSIVPALMCAVTALNAYFNVDIPMNSPVKVYELLMIVSLMLYFKDECGMYIGRPNIKPKYTFSVLLSIGLGGMVTLSRLVLAILRPDDFPISIVSSAYMTLLWIHIVTVSLSNYLRKDTESESTETNNTLDSHTDSEDTSEFAKFPLENDVENDVENEPKADNEADNKD